MSPFIDEHFEKQAYDRDEALRKKIRGMRERRYASSYKKKMRKATKKARGK